MPTDTAEMLRLVAQWVQQTYNVVPVKMAIYFHNLTEPVVLPLMPVPLPPAQPQQPAGAPPVEQGPGLSQVARDILTVLAEAGKPRSFTHILMDMSQHKPPMLWSKNSVTGHLDALVKDGTVELLTEGGRPRGYRICEDKAEETT
jgi:hypothetical protein